MHAVEHARGSVGRRRSSLRRGQPGEGGAVPANRADDRASLPIGPWPRRVILVLLVGYAAWYLFLAIGAPLPAVVNGLPDDSFYYLQVARHVAGGLGSTFDGVEPTNGYHPLWMWLLVPVQAVTRGAPEVSLRAALLLSGLLGFFSLWMLQRLLLARVGTWASVTGLLLFAWPRIFGLTTNLLESGLVLLLLLAVVWVLYLGGEAPWLRGRGGTMPRVPERSDTLPRTRAWVPVVLFGALFGTACLARLDTVFLPAAFGLIGLHAAWRRRFPWDDEAAPVRSRVGSLAATVEVLAVAVAMVVPYLAWNLAQFGHLQPVSGFVKSTFPHPRPHWAYLWMYKEFTILLVLGLVFFVASLRRGASTRLRILGLFGLAAALHMAWTVLFMGWGVDRWYFVLLVPVGLLGIPWLVEEAMARLPRLWCRPRTPVLPEGRQPTDGTRIQEWERRAAPTATGHRAARPARPARTARPARLALVAVGIVAAAGVQVVSYRLRAGRHLDATREVALWARDNLPADAVFGMSDAGVFAYFSGRVTVNLDGLINNYRYQEALRDGRFRDYLASRRIGFIYDQSAYRCSEVLDGTYRTRTLRFLYYPGTRVGGQVVLDRADEVYRRDLRSRPGAGAVAEPNALILYRYRPGAEGASPRTDDP